MKQNHLYIYVVYKYIMSKIGDKMFNTKFQEPQECVTTKLVVHWGIPMNTFISKNCHRYSPKK